MDGYSEAMSDASGQAADQMQDMIAEDIKKLYKAIISKSFEVDNFTNAVDVKDIKQLFYELINERL